MSEKTTLNLRIDKTLKERLKQKLSQTGETATEVIERALEAYCNDESVTCNDSNDDRNANSNYSNDGCNDSNDIKARLEQIELAINGDFATMGLNDEVRQLSQCFSRQQPR